MAALDVDALLGKPKNRVARVGVELEGGWTKLPEGAHLEHDGSVYRGMRATGIQYGEIQLGPMLPAQLPAAMRKYYPDHVNASCGLHLHMGFETVLHYSILMVPEYQDTIIEYVRRWAEKEGIDKKHGLWHRLSGKSEFCQHKFWPDEQARARRDHDQNRHGHRYTVINYCYTAHGTIECRLLQMFKDVEQSIRALRLVIDVTNACLLKLMPNIKETHKGKVEFSDTKYEEYVEEVL